MWRTVLAGLVIAATAYAATLWVTHDFQVWTAEGARRLEVALHPVPPPLVMLHGPNAEAQSLQRLLTRDGAVTIADFIYTRCTTVCRALGSTFQQMQSALTQQTPLSRGSNGPDISAVQLLSISFDSSRDDNAALTAYGNQLRADPGVWRFTRAISETDLQRLLDAYQVTVIPDSESNGLGGFEHNAALLVIDQRGRLVRVFDYAEHDIALAFARSLTAASSHADMRQ